MTILHPQVKNYIRICADCCAGTLEHLDSTAANRRNRVVPDSSLPLDAVCQITFVTQSKLQPYIFAQPPSTQSRPQQIRRHTPPRDGAPEPS